MTGKEILMVVSWGPKVEERDTWSGLNRVFKCLQNYELKLISNNKRGGIVANSSVWMLTGG